MNGIKTLRLTVDKLMLNTHNPRHDELGSEAEIYDYLCSKEKLLDIARDIVNLQSTNPLELLAVVQVGDSIYRVLEGNRRVAALKLLLDPDSAPLRCRSTFSALSRRLSKDDPLFLVDVAVFKSEDDARPWIERLHTGERNGTGRRRWNSQQKERFIKQGRDWSRHWKGLWLLEFAYEHNIAKKEEADKWLNIIDRWLSNPEFRAALGITVDNNKHILNFDVNNKNLFINLLKIFFNDIRSKLISTRANAKDMRDMANTYTNHRVNLLSSTVISATARSAEDRNLMHTASMGAADLTGSMTDDTRDSDNETPKRGYSSLNRLFSSNVIVSVLDNSEYIKHALLYKSLTNINVKTHSALVAVGIWSFLDSLANLIGKPSNSNFSSFFSRDRLQNTYMFNKQQAKSIHTALEDISKYGNLTKHDKHYARVDPEQLIISWRTVTPLIEKVIKSMDKRSGDSK